VKEEKARLRREIKEKISALDQGYLGESDRGIRENVLSLPEFRSARTVFAYLSVDRECDTRHLVDHLLQEGRRVALPRSRKGGVMDFALYDGTLAEGLYGIPQPPDEAEMVEPGEGDLILVPALCCDVRGVRLGHGGGYYDRYLAEHRAQTACLCRERLLLEKVPQDWNDFAVGFVITELRKIKTGL
jgi:5-formyltetrahydrofolate cyclo-ligase